MKKFLIFGISVALLSSVIGAGFTYLYYDKMFDFSSILPIWKVVAVYTSLSLILSLSLFFSQKYFKKNGVFILNTLVCMGAMASILYPMTYKNINVELVEMYPIVAIPLHFILPIIWLACQPLVLYNSYENK